MVNKTTYTSPDASTFDPVGKFILPALAGLDGPLVMVNPGLLLRLAKALLPDLTLEVFITDRDGGKGSLLLGEGRGGTPRGGGCWEVAGPPLRVPTGGCILESITMYFWSLEAEKERVVPTLTFRATFRGTFSKTGLAFALAYKEKQ